MAPTRAHRGDAHRSPVIETSSTRALFTVFYNHRMLTRSRRVIAHTRTQRAPIPPPLVRAPHFRRRPLPLERRPVAARVVRETPIESSLVPPDRTHRIRIRLVIASCRRESARRSSFIEDARPSKRTRARRRRRRDDDDARRRRRDDDDDGRKNRNSKSLKQTGTMADANLRINVRARVPFADKGA